MPKTIDHLPTKIVKPQEEQVYAESEAPSSLLKNPLEDDMLDQSVQQTEA